MDRLHQLETEEMDVSGDKTLNYCRVKASVFEEIFSKPTSDLDTELISAARESEKEADIKFLAPWMLRLIIWPFNSSFCSFRLRLSW